MAEYPYTLPISSDQIAISILPDEVLAPAAAASSTESPAIRELTQNADNPKIAALYKHLQDDRVNPLAKEYQRLYAAEHAKLTSDQESLAKQRAMDAEFLDGLLPQLETNIKIAREKYLRLEKELDELEKVTANNFASIGEKWAKPPKTTIAKLQKVEEELLKRQHEVLGGDPKEWESVPNQIAPASVFLASTILGVPKYDGTDDEKVQPPSPYELPEWLKPVEAQLDKRVLSLILNKSAARFLTISIGTLLGLTIAMLTQYITLDDIKDMFAAPRTLDELIRQMLQPATFLGVFIAGGIAIARSARSAISMCFTMFGESLAYLHPSFEIFAKNDAKKLTSIADRVVDADTSIGDDDDDDDDEEHSNNSPAANSKLEKRTGQSPYDMDDNTAFDSIPNVEGDVDTRISEKSKASQPKINKIRPVADYFSSKGADVDSAWIELAVRAGRVDYRRLKRYAIWTATAFMILGIAIAATLIKIDITVEGTGLLTGLNQNRSGHGGYQVKDTNGVYSWIGAIFVTPYFAYSILEGIHRGRDNVFEKLIAAWNVSAVFHALEGYGVTPEAVKSAFKSRNATLLKRTELQDIAYDQFYLERQLQTLKEKHAEFKCGSVNTLTLESQRRLTFAYLQWKLAQIKSDNVRELLVARELIGLEKEKMTLEFDKSESELKLKRQEIDVEKAENLKLKESLANAKLRQLIKEVEQNNAGFPVRKGNTELRKDTNAGLVPNVPEPVPVPRGRLRISELIPFFFNRVKAWLKDFYHGK